MTVFQLLVITSQLLLFNWTISDEIICIFKLTMTSLSRHSPSHRDTLSQSTVSVCEPPISNKYRRLAATRVAKSAAVVYVQCVKMCHRYKETLCYEIVSWIRSI